MAVKRDDPYGGFNYRITIMPKSGDEILGGFSEVSGLTTDITYADYREGTDPQNRPRKVPLTYKAGDVTLKRGVLGSMDVFSWADLVRRGDQDARASVTIELFAEDNSQVVATWSLVNARPSKWSGPTMTAAGGSEVAMEELTLVCEDITYT